MFFEFEVDFVESLRCIPMQVRMNLDTCGVKLKLTHWHQFSAAERASLVNLPCESGEDVSQYRETLQQLVIAHTGTPANTLAIDPHPTWLNEDSIPETIIQKAQEFAVQIQLEQWQNLSPLQRFALIKLSRPSHENRNFLPALQEFGVVAAVQTL